MSYVLAVVLIHLTKELLMFSFSDTWSDADAFEGVVAGLFVLPFVAIPVVLVWEFACQIAGLILWS